jgi:4'-phosphopantetheinyl transferase EntD
MSARGGDPLRPTVSDLVERVEEALQSMAPPWVRTGARAIHTDDEVGLWPNERAAISRAVITRRVEFATGRALLRRLIGDDVEIPVGPDRRPRFPVGISGTLAHDREIAVAATTTRPTCSALGVDIEPATVLDEDVARAICRPEEQHLDAHLVFVLKEAAYKAWSSLGGRLLDHWDVAVTVDPSDRTFRATVIPDTTSLTGRYVTVDDRYVALVIVDEID